MANVKRKSRNTGGLNAAIIDIGHAFQTTLEVEQLVPKILRKAVEYIGAEGGSIWLLSENKESLACTFATGPKSEQLLGMSLGIGEGIAGWVTQTQKTVLIADAQTDPRWASRFDEHLEMVTQTLACVPLIANGNSLGALELVNKKGDQAFDEKDQERLMALAGLAGLAIYNAQLFEKERRHRERQELLQAIGPLLHESLDLDRLLAQILDQVSIHLKAKATSVWLVDDKDNAVVCQVATGDVAEQVIDMSVPLGKGIVGLVASTGESTMVANAQDDPRATARNVDAITGFVTRSLLTVPLLRKGRCLGAIQVVNKVNPEELFTPFDQEMLEQLANSAAFAIENARLYNELEQSYSETLEALIHALDLKDQETQFHSRRVVEFTVLLAKTMHVDPDEIVHVRRAALLHDIGKMSIPDSILQKTGPLTAEERILLEDHPRYAFEMMAGIPFLAKAADIVLASHERYDGKGYPRGLSGEQIPLGARLFAVADTFDAMTSDRPYRKSQSYDVAMAEISWQSGKQFDPQVVDAFLSISVDEWMAIRERVAAEGIDRLEVIAALVESKFEQ